MTAEGSGLCSLGAPELPEGGLVVSAGPDGAILEAGCVGAPSSSIWSWPGSPQATLSPKSDVKSSGVH